MLIDVGANKGQFAQLLRSVGYKGVIHSIEPGSIAYGKLVNNSQHDGKWHAHKYAFGAENKKVSLSVCEMDRLSTLYKFNDYGHQFSGAGAKITKEEQVDMVVLDDFLSDQAIDLQKSRCLLKLDTQGHDLEVLKGASSSLAHIKSIQTELAFKSIYENVPSYSEVMVFCEQNGFAVSGMYPVNRDQSTLEMIEMDCVFVKK